MSIHDPIPFGMYPVDLIHPGFQHLHLFFPAKDAYVLEHLAQQHPGDFLEIGTFVGTSASILAKHAKRLLCLDTWTGSPTVDPVNQWYGKVDVLGVFEQNLKLFNRGNCFHWRITPEMGTAKILETLTFRIWSRCEWPTEGLSFSLAFIDGDHSYEAVVSDYNAVIPFMKPGGVICGHDYGLFPGVSKAADEFGIDGLCGSVWWKYVK